MADPISISVGVATNLISELMTGVVKKLYRELKYIVQCKKECELFKEQLNSLTHFLNEIEPIFQAQFVNSDSVKAWWGDLKTCLDESLCLVSSFRSAPNYDPRTLTYRRAFQKDILAKRNELERLVHDSKIDKALLFMIAKDLKVLTQDTKNYLHSGGDKQKIVAGLNTIKTLSRNEQISKHLVANSSLQDQHESLVGRKEIIEELEMLLLDTQAPKIIALHGMGGAGKTSIVRALINSPTLQSYFGVENLVWVAVGKDSKQQDFEAELQKHINEDKQHANEDKREIQVRRLIVLDDLWKTEEIRFVQGKSECGRHRFLITTRQLGMVDGYTNIKPIPVPTLSESESWKLFKYHAFLFHKQEHILNLENVAKQVAHECKGLPLALKVIGQAMSDKMTLEEWNVTLEEWNVALGRLKSHDIIDNRQEELLQVLRISYDALESIEKYMGKVRECFLYFGAFEEDVHIRVEFLMNCWVGEGLLKDDGNSLDQTYVILGVLIGSSLIEKVVATEHWGEKKEERCQIHDMLRDLALYISKHDRHDEDLFQGADNCN